MNKILVYILIINVFPILLPAQSKLEGFTNLRFPEKIWVIAHPFAASEAYRISQNVQKICASLPVDSILDGDTDGGTLDAFKHAYWMVSLCNEMHWRKALKLGKAHESSNKVDFENRRSEDGALPDSANSAMDALNNLAGIEIYKFQPGLSEDEFVQLIRKNISEGKLWVLRKDGHGKFTDCNGDTLPDKKIGIHWNISKCIVPSNYKNKLISGLKQP